MVSHQILCNCHTVRLTALSWSRSIFGSQFIARCGVGLLLDLSTIVDKAFKKYLFEDYSVVENAS